MAKRTRLKKPIIKTTKQLLKLQQQLTKQVKRKLPEQLKAMNVLLTRPDPQERGIWKKHRFIAPAFSKVALVPQLDYYIFEPSASVRHPSTEGMPLVVMLHGCQQDSALFAQGSQMNVVAQRNGFVVLYPQQSRRYHLTNCWHWYDTNKHHQGMAEAHSIMSIIQSTIMMHRLNPNKVFVVGLSAGAAMAGILAANFPAQFAGLAMHSGPVLGRAYDAQSAVSIMRDPQVVSDSTLAAAMDGFAPPQKLQLPTIILQGEKDKIVHPRHATELVKQLLHFNQLPMNSLAKSTEFFQGTTKEYNQSLYYDGRKRIIELIRIKHLDHAWAGGDYRLPFNSQHGPHASQLIWQFFKRYL
ncbi:PHB depolymerase family esterase [Pelistega sp. MC2]|uniref:extracellular catalytic domain type 1 short-chain-length polyhydroxyalkanoate depolymerase n=1 Tax=Pelistega sp. MC2 TaxID=1720297 RepID=UPI0008D9E242|nr:PHB depolymerase family esterase [Pelistega sp. MC2]